MADLNIRTDREELVFASNGTAWWVAAHGGPDFATMDDRQRAVLRALLDLTLRRLDRAEFEISTGLVRVGGENGDK